jgi:hypothetical protein
MNDSVTIKPGLAKSVHHALRAEVGFAHQDMATLMVELEHLTKQRYDTARHRFQLAQDLFHQVAFPSTGQQKEITLKTEDEARLFYTACLCRYHAEIDQRQESGSPADSDASGDKDEQLRLFSELLTTVKARLEPDPHQKHAFGCVQTRSRGCLSDETRYRTSTRSDWPRAAERDTTRGSSSSSP